MAVDHRRVRIGAPGPPGCCNLPGGVAPVTGPSNGPSPNSQGLRAESSARAFDRGIHREEGLTFPFSTVCFLSNPAESSKVAVLLDPGGNFGRRLHHLGARGDRL